MKKAFLSYDEISLLCLELSMFLHAGADCGGGLVLLSEDTKDPGLKKLLLKMADDVDSGAALSEAFKNSGVFPEDVYNMLKVGEDTGRSEDTLRSLARYYDSRARLHSHLRSALLYPSVLLLIMLAVIVVLLTKVLPIFSDVYASLGGELTGISGLLLSFGTALDRALPALCVVLAVLVLFLAAFAGIESFRTWLFGHFKNGSRKSGIFRKMDAARFSEALSMTLSSGLTAEDAVISAGKLLSDGESEDGRAAACIEALSSGASPSEALKTSGLLPAAECRLLELGLKSGSGDTAMEEIAKRLSLDFEDSLQRLVGRIEPIMVTATSILVGVILLSVMIPLANIMSVIG